MGTKVEARQVFGEQVLQSYFDGNNKAKRIKDLFQSINNVYHSGITWDELQSGKVSVEKCKTSLQYFKDERFLTLYSFAALDYLGDKGLLQQRCDNLNKVMDVTLSYAGRPWNHNLKDPEIKLEKQLPVPVDYETYLQSNEIAKHKNAYMRAIGTGKKRLEGPTHADAVITDDTENVRIVFEAKFLSDISCDTTFAMNRNQIARNIDAGFSWSKYEDNPHHFYFVLITPRYFQENWRSRLYGYKMKDYISDIDLLGKDLPHLSKEEISVLQNNIGWITWEDIYDIIKRAPNCNVNGLAEFFAERLID